MSGFWSSWVLVFSQLSGLNSSRLAHTETIVNTASTVVNTINPLISHRRRREIGPGADASIGAWSVTIGG